MLPWREVTGDDRPRNAMMKQTAATRYRRAETFSVMVAPPSGLLLELAQHALGDDEAAEDVHRGEHDRKEAQPFGEADLRGASSEQCADDDHARDRVGDRHQRR